MTYPEVSEIRTEWTPEQVAPTYADQRAHDVAWMTASEREAYEKQQQRLEQIRSGVVRPIPTVCPKR